MIYNNNAFIKPLSVELVSDTCVIESVAAFYQERLQSNSAEFNSDLICAEEISVSAIKLKAVSVPSNGKQRQPIGAYI